MKKTYMKPETVNVSVRPMTMIAGSGDAITSELLENVTYGGVDLDGEQEPSSRRGNDWDDEDEFSEN